MPRLNSSFGVAEGGNVVSAALAPGLPCGGKTPPGSRGLVLPRSSGSPGPRPPGAPTAVSPADFQTALGHSLDLQQANCSVSSAGTLRGVHFAQLPQSQVDYMLSKIPMGRLGEIEESAAMICFMASEECSFSTGGVFDISGGRATY